MQLTDSSDQLFGILVHNLDEDNLNWLSARLETIISEKSARDLFLTYTLLGNKLAAGQPVKFPETASGLYEYLLAHGASLTEISRVCLLSRVLEADSGYFIPKVAQLIQLADTGELKTFLRYLVLLPHAEAFSQVAVEALRTNIAIVFDAIALDNPYPALYFNDQQWNQMYLKAAFMQRDLSRIREVDRRANKDLARIISDYAHERWAASRDVDPLFWRPVAAFLDGVIRNDIKRLLASDNITEKRAGALCCYHSDNEEARALLGDYPELTAAIKNESLAWNNLKE